MCRFPSAKNKVKFIQSILNQVRKNEFNLFRVHKLSVTDICYEFQECLYVDIILWNKTLVKRNILALTLPNTLISTENILTETKIILAKNMK